VVVMRGADFQWRASGGESATDKLPNVGSSRITAHSEVLLSLSRTRLREHWFRVLQWKRPVSNRFSVPPTFRLGPVAHLTFALTYSHIGM
jgi:hypothetical protein